MLLSLCRQASSCCSQHNADQEHTHHVAHSIMQIKSIHIMLLTAPDMAHQNEQWQCLGNALLEQKLRYNAILQAHRTALKSRLQQLPLLTYSSLQIPWHGANLAILTVQQKIDLYCMLHCNVKANFCDSAE